MPQLQDCPAEFFAQIQGQLAVTGHDWRRPLLLHPAWPALAGTENWFLEHVTRCDLFYYTPPGKPSSSSYGGRHISPYLPISPSYGGRHISPCLPISPHISSYGGRQPDTLIRHGFGAEFRTGKYCPEQAIAAAGVW